jgi:hypothetical protein
VRIGIVDAADRDRWINLGELCQVLAARVHAQWLPGSDREVVFNDRERSLRLPRARRS